MYHVTENQSTTDELAQPSGMGLLLFRISFTHASQIPDIIPVQYTSPLSFATLGEKFSDVRISDV